MVFTNSPVHDSADLDCTASSSTSTSRKASAEENLTSDTTDLPDNREDVVRVLLERTASYSRIMHAHTKSAQLAIKSQNKRSVTASQVSDSTDAVIPATLPVLKMKLDEAPQNPTNTPVTGRVDDLNATREMPSSRRRSATDPVPRGFLIEKSQHTVLV
ncbi:hypothetical protein MRB53_040261 [Persea americana]|nr:hypothetical protein MRB53_040261 [Persea americana]